MDDQIKIRRGFLKLIGLGAVAAVTPKVVYSGQEPASKELIAEAEHIEKALSEGPSVNPYLVTKAQVGLSLA